jgi:hypothetical protein
MTDHDRAEVCKTLQREADTLANLAAASLEQKWMHQFAAVHASESAERGAQTGPGDRANHARDVEQMSSSMREGFVRLGSVVALSVLVDEPGLIADDIYWLTRMFGARQLAFNGDDWAADLLHSYTDACASLLPDTMCAPVRESVERALVLLGDPDTN